MKETYIRVRLLQVHLGSVLVDEGEDPLGIDRVLWKVSGVVFVGVEKVVSILAAPPATLVGLKPAGGVVHIEELRAACAEGGEGGPSIDSAIVLINDPLGGAGTLEKSAGLSLLELLLGKTGRRAGIDEVVETGDGLGLIREEGVSIGELVTGASLLCTAGAAKSGNICGIGSLGCLHGLLFCTEGGHHELPVVDLVLLLLGKVNRVLGAPHPALETWSSERERGQSTAEREREREKGERGRELTIWRRDTVGHVLGLHHLVESIHGVRGPHCQSIVVIVDIVEWDP